MASEKRLGKAARHQKETFERLTSRVRLPTGSFELCLGHAGSIGRYWAALGEALELLWALLGGVGRSVGAALEAIGRRWAKRWSCFGRYWAALGEALVEKKDYSKRAGLRSKFGTYAANWPFFKPQDPGRASQNVW